MFNVIISSSIFILLYRSEYHLEPGNSYGADLGNGTWNGLVGQILNNEVHISCNTFIWTSSRAEVVDFIDILTQARYLIKNSLKYIFHFIFLWDSGNSLEWKQHGGCRHSCFTLETPPPVCFFDPDHSHQSWEPVALA